MEDFPERDRHLDELVRSIRENDGFMPVEADEDLNDSARDLIEACHGRWISVYIGSFNEHRSERERDFVRVLRRLEPGEMVYNFSCDFAVPSEDEKLISAVLSFRDSPRLEKIEAVNQRVKDLGGVLLSWS